MSPSSGENPDLPIHGLPYAMVTTVVCTSHYPATDNAFEGEISGTIDAGTLTPPVAIQW